MKHFKENPQSYIHNIVLIALLIIVIFIMKRPITHFLVAVICYGVIVLLINYKNIYGDFALLEERKGNRLKAIKMYERAYLSNIKNAKMLFNYSMLLLSDKNYDKALEVLNYILSFSKIPLTIKNVELAISSALWLKGDYDKAIENLHQIEQKYGYLNEVALTTLGYLYMLKKDFENAVLYTEKALDVNKNFSSAYDNLGQIFYRQNNFEKAKEHLLKAYELNENAAETNYYLGLLFKEADKKMSRLYLEKALNCHFNAFTTVTKEEVLKELQSATTL